MKIQFETPEEYDALRQAAHDGILYWKKVRQMCQGKINMNVDGSDPWHDEQYAIDQMICHARVLRDIEASPRPVWNEETKSYELVREDELSHIVDKVLKLIPKTEVDY